jgi:sortase A
MNKILSFIIGIGIIAGVSVGFAISYTRHASKIVPLVQSEQALQKTNQAETLSTVSPGVPVSIAIPKINVQTQVESVGMDTQGRMDVPKNASDTAWYSPGYKPGTMGSAVIDGHLDRITGAPAVFWNLKELTVGDTIQIKENNGRTYTFAVSQVAKYPYNSFPIQQVFGAFGVPMLNLITCNGIWDKNTKNYSDRLVVYSKLVSEK